MFFICSNDGREIFGVKTVNVTIFQEVGRPAPASHLGKGTGASVAAAAQAADAETFVTDVGGGGKDGKSQVRSAHVSRLSGAFTMTVSTVFLDASVL